MNKVNTLKLTDTLYPESLKHIDSAPPQIYFIGAPLSDWMDRPKLAVVGSRKTSLYGREATDRLVGELARLGIVIISGLALGIDSIAHKAALDRGGLTVAILPTPINKIYPASHANLARSIIVNGGTVISEHSPGKPIYKSNFTFRNRIISGLADGVLITEAAMRSGSLTTARFGLEQGKTVMAVPGNITSVGSEGTNQLIKTGATPVTSVEDVLYALNINLKNIKKDHYRGTLEEEKLLELISQGVSDQEELAIKMGLEGAIVSSLLTSLEIVGQIRPSGGGQWSKT